MAPHEGLFDSTANSLHRFYEPDRSTNCTIFPYMGCGPVRKRASLISTRLLDYQHPHNYLLQYLGFINQISLSEFKLLLSKEKSHCQASIREDVSLLHKSQFHVTSNSRYCESGLCRPQMSPLAAECTLDI